MNFHKMFTKNLVLGSTQRRFQKIFEEAPPAICKPEVFKEMEAAAQRLTSSLGYQGAGTIEYLYDPKTHKFYFLELNPRLQVEHPCTEGVTDVNLPATQLLVAMGVPLNNLPEIRRLYGKDNTNEKIDFRTEHAIIQNRHICAARVTAENPNDGFRPTSGSVSR